MAQNFPGPYEVELFYTVDSLQHAMRINCAVQGTPAPGDSVLSISLKERGGGTVILETAVVAFVDLLKVHYDPLATFDSYNFWRYDAGTFDRTFISSNTLGVAGTNAGSPTLSHQSTLTFRTEEGGTMRLVLLESRDSIQNRVPYASNGAAYQAIFDFVVSTSSWLKPRDTSWAIASLNRVGGENERLFKKRNR